MPKRKLPDWLAEWVGIILVITGAAICIAALLLYPHH